MSELTTIPATALTAPPKQKTRVSEKKFVKVLVVRTKTGEKLDVPVSMDANRARTQLIAARATDLFNKQMLKWADLDKLPPRELKDIIDSAKRLQELNEAAHGYGGMPDAGQGPMNGLGKLVQGAVLAGAAAANGASADLAAEMQKLTTLGKKATEERRAREGAVEV